MTWQPIETAPYGQNLLVWSGCVVCEAGKAHGPRGRDVWSLFTPDGCWMSMAEPLNWMPIPELPRNDRSAA